MQIHETNNTDLVMEIASLNLFIFTVAAINVLGKGEDSDIISELYVLKELFCLILSKELMTS